jgi:hypothetical protein
MRAEEVLNAVELRPHHAGRLVEYTTVTTPEMHAYGMGQLGEPVTVRARVSQIENGTTAGRAWSRITGFADHAGGLVRIVNVLGSHLTVKILPEPDQP